ncbi:ABC transporter permease [Acinetobacter ihumii]|uniref:ABC transporter permease n=1 Tax=Acinetobacter ihumii TaxID=2483802 RepID=UPI0010305076|nr:ABC transporter permease [Acinetobacter ihumii]
MFASMLRELRYLLHNKWDLAMVLIAPLVVILLFSGMFLKGKPDHLPIAVIDQDQSELSRNIDRYLSLNHTLDVKYRTQNQTEAETLLNQTKIWGYVHIPAGAEQRLVNAQDAQISIAFNQSFFSVGNTVSSAMLVATLNAIADFSGESYFGNLLPYLDVPTPNVKISTLYNPNLSYEFYLEPFLIPAILHLLLCCCVAFAIGQELKRKTLRSWANQQNYIRALFAKILVYVIIFTLWTWAWMFWLIVFRGWFVAGSVWLILAGQILLYFAYACISSTVVLASQDLGRTFGFVAVYGGSSLSFAGVTLPLNNAPIFTQFWSMIIPYTPYARLQTEQWVVGSDIAISLLPFFILLGYCLFYFLLSALLMKKLVKE